MEASSPFKFCLPSETVCLEGLDQADSHDYLAQYVCRILAQGLAQVRSLPGLKSETERASSRLQRQIAMCNEIIEALQQGGIEGLEGDKVSAEAHRLLEVLVKASSIKSPQVRPDTPLSLGALLTGTRQDPSLVSQFHKEIITADRVDVLCSFIKWSGIPIPSLPKGNTPQSNGMTLRQPLTHVSHFHQILGIYVVPGCLNPYYPQQW